VYTTDAMNSLIRYMQNYSQTLKNQNFKSGAKKKQNNICKINILKTTQTDKMKPFNQNRQNKDMGLTV
jgi:hypothetical protein